MKKTIIVSAMLLVLSFNVIAEQRWISVDEVALSSQDDMNNVGVRFVIDGECESAWFAIVTDTKVDLEGVEFRTRLDDKSTWYIDPIPLRARIDNLPIHKFRTVGVITKEEKPLTIFIISFFSYGTDTAPWTSVLGEAEFSRLISELHKGAMLRLRVGDKLIKVPLTGADQALTEAASHCAVQVLDRELMENNK